MWVRQKANGGGGDLERCRRGVGVRFDRSAQQEMRQPEHLPRVAVRGVGLGAWGSGLRVYGLGFRN